MPPLQVSPPLRVTHIITRLIVGGAQENTVATVLGLRNRSGLHLDLIAGPTTGSEGSLELALASYPGVLTVLPHLVRPVHPWKDAWALVELIQLLRARQPHLVHTHSGKAGVLGRLAARRARVPIVVHTVHGPSFGPFQGPLANAVFCAAEKLAARYTTHFVVVAEALRQRYLQAGVGRPEQFSCIRSGFALEPFLAARNDLALRARWGLGPEHFVVGKIARLFKLKGHDDLLAAAVVVLQQQPQVRFLLVGDGPGRPRLQQKVRQLGLQGRVVFTGLVKPEQIPKLIGLMDAVVHLSRREGLPRALAQALAAGRPVVAYDCDGAGEVCLNQQTGFLLEPGDVAGLAQRLVQLAGDPDLCRRLGQRGQELVRQQFSLDRMLAELERLYWRLAQQQGLSPAPPVAPSGQGHCTGALQAANPTAVPSAFSGQPTAP